MKKLNIGCGSDIKEGWINLDYCKAEGIDVVHDLEKKLPFKDNEFDLIYASHILEHIKNYEQLIGELRRILKEGGILEIKVPHHSYQGAYTEWHTRFFNWYSFKPRGNTPSLDRVESYSGFKPIYKRLKFEKKVPYNYIIEPIANISPDLFEHTCFRNIFPAKELHIKLKKI